MDIDYLEINKRIEKYENEIKPNIQRLENKIIDGRDNDNIPIYLTKWRIKKPESTYLKVKKNGIKDLNDIQDYAGLKVICLFEQDILNTHIYLLNIFKELEYHLDKCEIYNWFKKPSQKYIVDQYKSVVKENFDINAKVKTKKSGYKSIHYIVNKSFGDGQYYVEVQLQTLFQDAWSELEHTLVYKRGNVHPHIQKSFKLLAQDLETNDILIDHLKSISDREGIGHKYLLENIGPHKWFGYEPDLIADVFKINGETKDHYEKYIKCICSKDPRFDTKDWIDEATGYFENVCQSLKLKDSRDKKVKYWVKTEKAYLTFCNNDYQSALDIYEPLSNDFPDRYITFFRMGEIFFIRGEIENALVNFDISENILANKDEKDLDYENLYRINIKLGYIYWTLGEEFINFVLEKVHEAENIYKKNKTKIIFEENDYRKLLNNLTYYNLEKFLICKREYDDANRSDPTDKKFIKIKNDYDIALANVQNEYGKIEELFKTEDPKKFSANMYDTVAWYNYQMYLTGKTTSIDKARQYAKEVYYKINLSPFIIESANLQLKHIQEIMSIK